MKIVKILIQTVVILLLLVALVGWLLPSEMAISRKTNIDAPASQIYEVVNNLKVSQEWSPWYKIDPDSTVYTFEGPESGIGAKMSWTSNNPEIGNGSQKIIESNKPTLVKYEMTFEGFEKPSYASFIIVESGGQSQVEWNYEGDVGVNPFYHYMTLMMDGMLGPYYEQGLQDLKTMVENMPDINEESDMEMQTEMDSMTVNE
ncbi:Polyketide cyclase / dehydrase and lipid transport [Reichenbachiella agariperforans]|uniref:Polyketide cyclase / dehydrase and lipid transport n=1 Tax=Reichenbachiella agariperforans TaxID=156994 RepID=A0A1M6JHU2_REIAG|nr:SRPBCC family protein [Reichenbachiella agariperforans]SHJ46205.1 Polyketide cyclase / dehydrase and lipid transport [Reichenbachiella agariperforans]